MPNAGQIVVVDRQRGVVASTWPLEGVAANFPMALDEAGHRLFVAARRPSRLPAYDTESGQRVGELEICSNADDLFFDRQRQQLYAVCGEGRFDVVQQRDADRLVVTERGQTSRGARTGRFAPWLSTSRAPLDAMPLRGAGGWRDCSAAPARRSAVHGRHEIAAR